MGMRTLGSVANDLGNHHNGQYVAATDVDRISDGFWKFGILLDQKAYALKSLDEDWQTRNHLEVWGDVDSIVEAVFTELRALLSEAIVGFAHAMSANRNEENGRELALLKRYCEAMKQEIDEVYRSSASPVLAMNNLLNINNNSIDIAAVWAGRSIDDFRDEINKLARWITSKEEIQPLFSAA